jgi:oxygen-independent coproporphyrinogen-3 oxidase
MTERETVGAYIHIPFCESKCDYCDFYSIVTGNRERENYVLALQKEISSQSSNAEIIDTIYFGGGNPGLLLPEQVSRILQTIQQSFALSKNPEITLECNPESINGAGLKELRQAGINRISFGVQTFSRTLLERLGRKRSKDPAAIISEAMTLFSRVSLDFMVGIPGQTIADLQEDLRLIPLGIGHLSIYDLTLYPETRLAERVEQGLVFENTEEENEALDVDLLEALRSRGYFQYEVSNFSKPTQQSKHNLHYWHYDDYRAFGAGAVSSWKGLRTTNSKLESCLQGKTVAQHEELSVPTQKLEWLMMNLRLTEGFERSRYLSRFGVDAVEEYHSAFTKQQAFFSIQKDRIALTPQGLRFHHTILSEFIND